MVIYLILINAAGLLFMLIDKRRAVKDRYRIPEKALLSIALIGGSIGCIAGMNLFRHKTRKPIFSLGLPVILAVQAVLAIILYSL